MKKKKDEKYRIEIMLTIIIFYYEKRHTSVKERKH